MKISITSFGPNLTSQLCPRFGSCAYFLVITPENMNVDVFDNKNVSSTGCNGSRAARFLISKNVHAVITGRCRPETFQILSDAGVYMYLNQSGTVKEVLGHYRVGHLRRAIPVHHSNRASSAVASYWQTDEDLTTTGVFVIILMNTGSDYTCSTLCRPSQTIDITNISQLSLLLN